MTNIMTNIVLYCIVLYCIVLYCIVFYCIVLYCYLKSITYFCLQTTGLIYHVTQNAYVAIAMQVYSTHRRTENHRETCIKLVFISFRQPEKIQWALT